MIKRYKAIKSHRATRTSYKILTGSKMRYKLVARPSNKYISAYIVDMEKGTTVAGVRAKEAALVGSEIAKQAIKIKVKKIVFDRGAYKYHGRIKQLADSAREAGLIF